MSKPVCVVIGVGPGNGTAIARKFAAQGYALALCSRTLSKLSVLADELPDAGAFAYDVTDSKAAERVFTEIEKTMARYRLSPTMPVQGPGEISTRLTSTGFNYPGK